MKPSQIFPLVALLAVAVAAPWMISRQSRAELSREAASLRQEVAQIPQLRTEHTRLSNLVAEAATAPHVARYDDHAELARLQRELEALRQQTNELARASAEAVKKNSTSDTNLAHALIGKTFARGSWNFVGYDTPEATLQSFMWAARGTNWDKILAAVTPKFRAWIEENMKKPEEKLDEDFDEMANQTKELRITDAEALSDDGVVIYTKLQHFDDEATEVPFHLKKIDGQWKVDQPDSEQEK